MGRYGQQYLSLIVTSIWFYLYRNIHKNAVYLSVYAMHGRYLALAVFQQLKLSGVTCRRVVFLLLVSYEVLKVIVPTKAALRQLEMRLL